MVLLIPRCLGYKAPVHRIRLCILHDAVDLSPFQTQYWLPLVYWQPGSLVGRSQTDRFGVASYQYWVKQSWINFIRFRFQPSWGVMVIQSFIHAFSATGPGNAEKSQEFQKELRANCGPLCPMMLRCWCKNGSTWIVKPQIDFCKPGVVERTTDRPKAAWGLLSFPFFLWLCVM